MPKERDWLMRKHLWVVILLELGFVWKAVGASYNMVGGEYADWPSTWTAITNLNDPDDGLGEDLDIVGDASDPAGYWRQDENYVYFRMRIDNSAGVSNVPNASYFVMIRPGETSNIWGLAWDAKSDNNNNHGLEMVVSTGGNAVVGTSWGATRVEDVDGTSGSKISPPDFGVANGDGYVRTTDAVGTTSFGTTTYIDFAAKWSYLRANTGLNTGQVWSIQFGTIAGSTDHGYIGTDVAANCTPTTTPLTYGVSVSTVPMLSALALLVLGGAISYAFFRRHRLVAVRVAD